MLWWLISAGCGSGPSECGPAECAEVLAQAAAGAQSEGGDPSALLLEPHERTLILPLLEDLRAGIRPFGEDSVGVCRGAHSCDEFLGTDVGVLPPGDYVIMAELAVPRVGGSGAWTATFETQCTLQRPGAEPEVVDYNRTYALRHAGADRGFRILPLRTIASPAGKLAADCTWKLTAPHPGTDAVFSGSWQTPAK